MTAVPDALGVLLADRYRVQRELGAGGMATVYLAEDLKHKRDVAVKVLRPELAASLGVERFAREIEIAAKLRHRHIVPLYDSGEAGGYLFYVMPYVEGESLRDRLRREKQLPVDDALQISRELADALSYAHDHGVIHRDIKPENILLEGGHAVLADFGIAWAVEKAGGEKLTRTGLVLGTPAYMSPEQAAGGTEIDGRSDLYSLACVLYEMLAGHPPFVGVTAESLIHQHLAAEPPNITGIRPSVPGWVVAALTRSLAKTPADRYYPVAQFAEAIAPRLPLSDAEAASRPARRRWPWVVAAAAVVVAGLLVGREVLSRSGRPTATGGVRPFTVVAEFDGSAPTDIRDAVRRLVMTEIDRSQLLEVLPQSQVRRGLASARLPETTSLVVPVAAELAVRGRIATVIRGTVEKLGSSYTLTLRALEAETQATLATARADAAGDDALISGTSRAVRALRRDLGERGADLGTERGGTFVVTPSFEAFRWFRRASRMSGDNTITASREAIRIDSGFAMAWLSMGVAYLNQGLLDSAVTAYQMALRFPDRLSENTRHNAEGLLASVNGDPVGALRSFELSGTRSARMNQQQALFSMGRVAESAAISEGLIRNSPYGPEAVLLLNYAETLVGLGRLTEADRVVKQLASTIQLQQRAFGWIACARADWDRVDSLGSALVDAPGSGQSERVSGTELRVSALSARGQVARADELLARAANLGPRATKSRALLQLVVSGGSGRVDNTAVLDQGTGEALAHAALLAAARGQPTAARYLSQLEAHESPETIKRLEGVRRVTRALLLEQDGKSAAAVEELRPLRDQVDLRGQVELFIRWITAEGFQSLGQLDSAAYFYERIVASNPLWGAELLRTGILHSFARQRLVVLYARLGRIEDARRHWNVFSATFTTPDREYVHLVDEARAALADPRHASAPKK